MTPEEAKGIPCGQLFRHYKWKIYSFVDVARHSETEEWFVAYRTDKGDLWVRPFDMFFNNVTLDGKQVARFKRLS